MTKARERFVHLAEARTRKAIKLIRLIGNLSNQSNYSYSGEDIDKIFRTLRKELKAAQDRFAEQHEERRDVDFSL